MQEYFDLVKFFAVLTLALALSSCSGTRHYEHFNVEEQNGFWRSYAYTEIKDLNGKVIHGSGRLTICTGIAGFVSDVMQNSVVLGASALIGAGLSGSGDTVNNSSSARSDQSQNQQQTQSSFASSSSQANSAATSSSASSTGLTTSKPSYIPRKKY